MSAIYLDTHVAIYLHDGLTEELSSEAKRRIDDSDLLISPMVVLEFKYLFVRKKVSVDPKSLLAALAATFGVGVCALPFASVVFESLDLDWTTDPFDRLIVGHAAANRMAPLITRDRLIRHHYPGAVW